MSDTPVIMINDQHSQHQPHAANDLTFDRVAMMKTQIAKLQGRINGEAESMSSFSNFDEDDDDMDMALEDQLTNQKLKELEQIFEEADEDGGGGLDMDEFRNAMREALGEHLTDEELDRMFMKVDTNCDGTVDWDEYLSYMLLEYREKDAMNYSNKQKPLPQTTRLVKQMQNYQRHHDSIIKIERIPNSTKLPQNLYKPTFEKSGRYVTITKDGIMNFWNTNLSHIKKQKLQPYHASNKTLGLWVTAMVVMPNVNLICIASTSGTLVFYDYNAYRLMPVKTITKLEICVSCLSYWMDTEDINHSILTFGDTRGNIMAIELDDCQTMCFFQHSLNKNFKSLVEFPELLKNTTCGVRAYKLPNIHEETVIDIQYFPNLHGCFLSCCRRNDTAMYMGDLEAKKGCYFPVNKGINSFAYFSKTNIIVTGGKDTLVRVWNPYVPSQPVMILSGQKSPILYVFIHEEMEHVISISQDKDIIIFDMSTQTAIQTIRRKHVNMGPRILSAACFNEHRLALILGSNQMALLEHQEEDLQSKVLHSHDKPVNKVAYNSLFDQLVSGGSDSRVCVWNANTGERVMQFTAHKVPQKGGGDLEIEITSMSFDPTLRRLITGARDGSVKIWNFNNGALLRTLEHEEKAEVTAIVCPKQRILTTGWNRLISMYVDSYDDDTVLVWQKRHRDDITAMDYKAPSTVVSGSYDGDILVWSLETGYVTIRFNAHISAKRCSMMDTLNPNRLNRPSQAHIKVEPKEEAEVSDEPLDLANWMSYNTHRQSIAAPIPYMVRRQSRAVRKNAIRHQLKNNFAAISEEPMANLLGIPAHFREMNISANNSNDSASLSQSIIGRKGASGVSGQYIHNFNASEMINKMQNSVNELTQTLDELSLRFQGTSNGAPVETTDRESTSSSRYSCLPPIAPSNNCNTNNNNTKFKRKASKNYPKLPAPMSEDEVRKQYDQYVLKNEASIEQLLLLQKRQTDELTATLIAVSAGGWIRFWSVDHNGGLLGQFNAAHVPGESVQAVCVDENEEFLITGDTTGYIKVWDISEYCTSRAAKFMNVNHTSKSVKEEMFPLMFEEQSKLRQKHKHQSRFRPPPLTTEPNSTWIPPPLLNSFRGHLHPITDITYIPLGKRVATSSVDCSVRVWTIYGQFIGICGQETPWQWTIGKGSQSSLTTLPSTSTKMSLHKTISRRAVKKPLFERGRRTNRSLPPDVRRVASATTLRVLNGGIRPYWRLAKNIVLVWVPLLALSRKKKSEEEEKKETVNVLDTRLEIEQSDITDRKPIESRILGKTYKQIRKHHALPELRKLRQFHNQCDAYASLPCFDLTPITEVAPPASLLAIQERQKELLFSLTRPKSRIQRGMRRLRVMRMMSFSKESTGPGQRKTSQQATN